MIATIDVQSRRRYARLLRSLATGRITNFEYEDAVNESVDFSKDGVLRAMFRYVWNAYDDKHKHKLEGEYALPREAKREIAKWILFLYTDLEYRWPTLWQRFSSRLYKITGGRLGKPLNNEPGDEEFWPFYNREEFLATIKRPVDFKGPACLVTEGKTRSRLSRLLPYPVIWKAGITFSGMAIWALLKWRSIKSEGPVILGIGFLVAIIFSINDRKKFSDLKWWQALIILFCIFFTVPVIILLLKYFTN